MGLPYVALSLVSVIMFTDLGIGKEEVTFWTSLLVLPWSLKPLFSLCMELFGTKRQYVFLTECISALMFGCICFILPLPSFFVYAIALMGVLAISGSMHDIAGDGIYMKELSHEQQGQYAGWQGAFYNLAKILTNGGLVYLAGVLAKTHGLQMAWIIIMGICAAIMFSLSLYHLFILPREEAKPKKSTDQAVIELYTVVFSFFRKRNIWLYLIFIFLYRLAEGLTMKVAPIFLKDNILSGGIGLSNETYGVISILSGYYIAHFGLKRVLFSLVCIFNIPFAVYLLFAIFQPQGLGWLATGIIFEYFSYGFGFVGITLFMMQQIAPGPYQMAHYAFANSLMNLSVMIPGMISGWLVGKLGYQSFFILVMVVTLPAILMAARLPFVHKEQKAA